MICSNASILVGQSPFHVKHMRFMPVGEVTSSLRGNLNNNALNLDAVVSRETIESYGDLTPSKAD